MKKSKVSIAKEYCQRIYDKHGLINQELLVAYDKSHGKKLLTWDDATAAKKFRIEEAAEWIAKIAMDAQDRKGQRLYHNATKITETGATRAYFPVEDIVTDTQMYESARAVYFSQIEGLNRTYSYLEEARILASAVEKIKEPVKT